MVPTLCKVRKGWGSHRSCEVSKIESLGWFRTCAVGSVVPSLAQNARTGAPTVLDGERIRMGHPASRAGNAVNSRSLHAGRDDRVWRIQHSHVPSLRFFAGKRVPPLSLRSCVGMTIFEDMLQSASDSRSREKIQATGLPLRSGGQEVDVGFGDQVFFGDVEGGEQVVGDFLAFAFLLVGTEHYF